MASARPVALVTGASSGIGAEFARQLAARGFDLILVARRKERLEQLAATLQTNCEILPADLESPEECRMVAGRIATEPRLLMLINNAGFGTKYRFWELPLETNLAMHELHVMAAVELTHAALKAMVPRGDGAVINVASVAGFATSPSNVSYCATKAWMVAFTEGLELELRGLRSGVQTQALCPGFTYSEFHDVAGVSRDTIPKHLWMSAESVVRASLNALKHRRMIVIPGWKYRLFVRVFGLLPRRLRMYIQLRSSHTKSRMR
ncbi:MAG: SDR family oxidoreductase [Candidatus Solibacter usitatus]|nr:SDR family oxidoreductase [Candidatus Solibacter usitatus]